MLVSLEIVPRDREALESGAAAALAFPRISHINVPDLLRFSIRSWEANDILDAGAGPDKPRPFGFIPHLRAIDFDLDQPFPHREFFSSRGITKVLVIAGDPPKDPGHRTYPTETVPFIRKLKKEMPGIEIYGAFDPYRSNIRFELDYLKEKEDAGAAGFMSQPFFDLRLLEIYAEYLEGKNVFWGISPVLTESSRGYWESRNRAVFPKHFKPDLYWNVDFGRRVLNYCTANNFNLYLMPIKVNLEAYLSGLFT
ncbi:methylenetetrahydrofolate reductase [Breznakiella homolactica]|uniref:Methylenetetrahydrofolate reductase n=1 Tax=Breznakiella homolactica TaxID=2798577 RepID=A0A7T7XPI5_9SPIR|nr:methylenetetrahydrofolate reductase [Breznakiella homolactica]QQO10077.1 methylenetetrahydrofolate reductase [Breznakiella homolactica]